MPYSNAPIIYFKTRLCEGVDPSAPLSSKQEEIHAWRMTHAWGNCQDPDKPWARYFGRPSYLDLFRLPVLQNDPPRLRRAIEHPRVESSDRCDQVPYFCCEYELHAVCAARAPTHAERKRAFLLRSLSILAADAEDVFAHSGLDSDLATARIFRATTVALATGEHHARLQKMADVARLLLEADPWGSHGVPSSGFETLEEENDGNRCAQPFTAAFSIPSQDFVFTGRKGGPAIARRLLEAAVEWPIFWRDRGHEMIRGETETTAQTAARKTTSNLCRVLSPTPLDPRTIDASADPRKLTTAPPLNTDVQRQIQYALEDHFSSTPPEQWTTKTNAREVVQLFLKELGVPWTVRKNYLSFLDKPGSKTKEETPDDAEPTSERRPRTPTSEDG